MSLLSSQGYNAIIYMTYVFLLATGLFLAWKFARKDNFLSGNGTQSGLPLAFNFIASGMYIDFTLMKEPLKQALYPSFPKCFPQSQTR